MKIFFFLTRNLYTQKEGFVVIKARDYSKARELAYQKYGELIVIDNMKQVDILDSSGQVLFGYQRE